MKHVTRCTPLHRDDVRTVVRVVLSTVVTRVRARHILRFIHKYGDGECGVCWLRICGMIVCPLRVVCVVVVAC